MRVWIIVISIGIIFGISCVSLLGIFGLKTDNMDELSSIYTNSDYSEAKYSGTTKEKAQHLVEIAKNSWQQGCEIEKKCFLPHMKTIMVNDVIMFVNQDDFEHNILLRGDSQYLHFPADVIRQNEYFVYKFNVPGEYDYVCTLHPWMEGIIQVN